MKMKHFIIEGYCDGKESKKDLPCKNTLNMGVHCLQCLNFSYVKCPNESALTGNEGMVEQKEDFIGFGGDMEPELLKRRDDYISVWRDICREKISEAYEEYINYIADQNDKS